MADTCRPLRHASAPCSACPWRTDQPAGRFAPDRFAALRDTSSGPRGESAPPGAPLFACHKTAEGREVVCAGWLAVEGRNHVGVRIAVLEGRLTPDALEVGEEWPELYPSFSAMATANHADHLLRVHSE